MGIPVSFFCGINMNSFASVLFLASAVFAAPEADPKADPHFYRPGFGSYGYGSYTPLSLSSFRYANNPVRNVVYQPSRNIDTAFGSFSNQGITPDQRATYLPVMKALLKVMESNRPSIQDINTLMVLTRELNKKVPKGQNLLGNFGNFGIDNLESMGLPEYGDIITNVNGIPHIRTTFGNFPLSDTNLMTPQERNQFLPITRTFTKILEKGSASAIETQQLLNQAQKLSNLLSGNSRSGIQRFTANTGRSFNY